MKSGQVIKPDFLIIGAQRGGTTWLWKMLGQHPGTDLRLEKKELHFFGSSEIYSKGKDWYYSKFSHLDPSKVVGEGSTTYLYDNVPYWHNPTRALEFDHSLPTIPELITNELPDVKIFMILRDPVKRAISAYNLRIQKRAISPFFGLKKAAEQRPKMRILEYGYYARYIRLWKKFVPPERMRIYIFEQNVLESPEETLENAYSFLNLDVTFKAENPSRPANRSRNWTRLALDYYTGRLSKKLFHKRPIAGALDRFDFLKRFIIKEKDIEFLRSVYLPQKDELENLIGRNLDCWTCNQ